MTAATTTDVELRITERVKGGRDGALGELFLTNNNGPQITRCAPYRSKMPRCVHDAGSSPAPALLFLGHFFSWDPSDLKKDLDAARQ
jgi:hypothetical protein